MPHGIDHREPPPVHDPNQLELPFEKVERGVSFLRHGARRFAERNGRTYSAEGLDQVQAMSQFQTRVASRYENAPVYAGDKRVGRSYAALAAETHEQFKYLTTPRHQGGLGVNVSYEPELDNTSIYPTADHLIKDVHENRRLRVNKTGSAEGDQAVGHPFLDPETNDKFRAVHDAFGHAAVGRSFSRHGEEAAFHSHRQMYSPEAHLALMVETRAQNSALNYGRNPGQFPEQKPIHMPQWMVDKTNPAAKRR